MIDRTEEDFTSPADATTAKRALNHLDTYSYTVNSSGKLGDVSKPVWDFVRVMPGRGSKSWQGRK